MNTTKSDTYKGYTYSILSEQDSMFSVIIYRTGFCTGFWYGTKECAENVAKNQIDIDVQLDKIRKFE